MCSVTSDIKVGAENASATQYQPTIDQTIADAIHTNQPFKSIETGVLSHKGINMGTVGDNLAHRGKNDFLPPERDPAKLFNTLFKDIPTGSGGTGGTGTGGTGGTGGSPGLPTDISNKLRRSVLDAVLEDANRLKTIVGSVDASRIDAHMDGIRTLELRIPADGSGGTGMGGMGGTGGTSTSSCTPPTTATTFADMTAKSKAFNRLITAALACNLTRVFTHLWSGPRDDNTYPTININSAHHDLTHAGKKPEHTAIERYIMSQYADLAQVMKDTPMGAGSVLDQTLIYGISEVSEPQWHVHDDYRIILMGHAGGQLPGNQHLRLSNRKITELMLTMQQVMGLEVSTYGSWDRTTKTMPEILG
jgi:hypothetical protein